MSIKIIALATIEVQQLRSGHVDANGQHPEQAVCDGNGNPCRHCLKEIPHTENMLIFAHRPFSKLQPYAEVGPIFICEKDCERYPEDADIPLLYQHRQMLVRAYSADERIIYGTGKTTPASNLAAYCQTLLSLKEFAFAHVRSPTNNCYHFRIE